MAIYLKANSAAVSIVGAVVIPEGWRCDVIRQQTTGKGGPNRKRQAHYFGDQPISELVADGGRQEIIRAIALVCPDSFPANRPIPPVPQFTPLANS